MSVLGTTLIHRFENHFPLCLGEKGDPNGLHIGTLNREINRVMITLDVRPNVVQEAIDKKVDLIIAKHPPLFRPAERLTDDDPQTHMYNELIRHNITVYAAHTNMDIVEDGLNDWFCEALGVHNTQFLSLTHHFPYYLLRTTVPTNSASEVRQAIAKAGAGKFGYYQSCSFSTNGTGRFEPLPGAQPKIGSVNQLESVSEVEITAVASTWNKEAVTKALLSAHPYETPSYQWVEIENMADDYGIGRIGTLDKPMNLEDFTRLVKNTFDMDHVRLIAKNVDQKVQRVAICGGSGQKFYKDAIQKGADVYITGDVYYHTGHDMLESGMPVIDAGHYIEHYCKDKIKELLEQWKQECGWDVDVIVSKENTNPFRVY